MVAILLSTGGGQLTNTQRISHVRQLFLGSALHIGVTTHAAIISAFADRNGGGEISNQATECTFMCVSMCELVQMFLCVMSFCAFCGCHHFYSYSGRSSLEACEMNARGHNMTPNFTLRNKKN